MTSQLALKLESNPEKLNSNITGTETAYKNDFDLICYEKLDLASTVEFLYMFSSTFQYILMVISVLGVLMNATGIYILSTTHSMKNTFNFLLVSLNCFDTLYLLSHIFMCLNLKYARSHGNISIVLSRFVKLLYSAAFNASTFLTVGISHERYIAMHHPLIHHQAMESKKNRRLHFIRYFLPIIVVSFVLVVPEFLDVEFIWKMRNLSEIWDQTMANHRSVTRKNIYINFLSVGIIV
jgi:hypothetical protein